MLRVTTHVLLAALATGIATGLVALTGCTAPAKHASPSTSHGVLTSMGFALTDDGDPTTPSGSLDATFSGPVVDIAIDGGVVDGALGTAHVAFDDGARDLSAASVLHAFPDNDVVYAVLFEEDAPWRYVIVAAHAGDVADGADIALDGANAAALVVDENTGSGFLSSSGSFHVDSASLVDNGTLAGSLSAELVEVGLETWPESLFPFSTTGDPSERAAASGGGTFNAVYSADGSNAPGTASVTVDVAGFPTFTGGAAWAGPIDDADTVILIESADGSRSELALFVENSALAAGGTLSLGGYVAGASLMLEDGTQVGFVDGTLTIDAADVVEGGAVSGSFSVTGDAYVMPPGSYGDPGTGDPNGGGDVDCTGIDTLASSFAPAQVYVEQGIPADQMPAGYDKALTFTDATTGMLGVLVSTDVDLHAGTAYSFSTVDYEGRPFPAAVLGLATCDQMIEVESGTLTATLDDAAQRMSGSLTYVVDGASRSIDFDLPLVQQ